MIRRFLMPQSSNLCSPELLDPRVEVIRIIWNDGKYSPNEWVLHPRRCVSVLSRWPIRLLRLVRCTVSQTIILLSTTVFRKSFLKSLGIVLGRDSSVDIATRYELDDPGNESLWGRHFPHPSRPASCIMGTGSFPRVKRSGCGVDHPPYLAPRLKKE
jgi:hypothetical protein